MCAIGKIVAFILGFILGGMSAFIYNAVTKKKDK